MQYEYYIISILVNIFGIWLGYKIYKNALKKQGKLFSLRHFLGNVLILVGIGLVLSSLIYLYISSILFANLPTDIASIFYYLNLYVFLGIMLAGIICSIIGLFLRKYSGFIIRRKRKITLKS